MKWALIHHLLYRRGGRMPCEGARDHKHVSTSQGAPGPTINQSRKEGFSSGSFQGSMARQQLGFSFIGSRTDREYTFFALCHPVCDILLWHPQETNTVSIMKNCVGLGGLGGSQNLGNYIYLYFLLLPKRLNCKQNI